MRTEQQIMTDLATVDAKLDQTHLVEQDQFVDLDITDHAIGCDILSVAGVEWNEIEALVRTALERKRYQLEHELSHLRLEEVDGTKADQS